nr:MAG TPA: AT hook containing protein [Caudoviricetes sp.]
MKKERGGFKKTNTHNTKKPRGRPPNHTKPHRR